METRTFTVDLSSRKGSIADLQEDYAAALREYVDAQKLEAGAYEIYMALKAKTAHAKYESDCSLDYLQTAILSEASKS